MGKKEHVDLEKIHSEVFLQTQSIHKYSHAEIETCGAPVSGIK